ncbi:Innexin [Operophtera brumata]|uniref:Innexin n=1 Tax=Operophtera brumata TaxID=104452 RepID=A0A0L7L390_OPEBR|nr:Innexin [Operophtera brumata]
MQNRSYAARRPTLAPTAHWTDVTDEHGLIEPQGVNPKIDSLAFRLHCGATTAALLAASAALTTRHLVGNPIDCIHTRDIPEDVLNTYCWIHSTFTVAGEAGAYPGNPSSGSGSTEFRY